MGELLGVMSVGLLLPFLNEMSIVMKLVSMVVPRLDLMAQTSWLLYGSSGDVGFSYVLIQGVVYSALLIGAAFVDLNRRQF